MKKITLLLALLISQIISAQIEDALVFFADKENVQQAINNPITILTQAAIDRKALHNIPIDERDVPVNENYITQIKAQSGITVLAKSKWMNCVYVRGTQSDIQDLANLPFVVGIEYADKTLNFAPVTANPVEDKFAVRHIEKNFNYGFASNQIEMISGDYLHDQGYTGEGIIIAFMDNGYPGVETQGGFSHMMSNRNLLGTYDFVNRTEVINSAHSHGTRTLSTIAGFIENEYVGTAPDASFYLFRTEDVSSETPVEEAYWVEAVERADSLGVHIINTSLGYRTYDNPAYSHTYEDLDGNTTIAARGANIGFEKGMLLVNSAGNSGNTAFPWVSTPADAHGIFTVGAVNANGDYASFSSIGPTFDGRIKPDVVAQGASAYVINQDNDIITNSGTSLSSPIIAGAIACLWQARPEYSNAQIMQIVRASAHLFNSPTSELGYGIPDFQTALETLLHISEYSQNVFKVYPNPVFDDLYFEFPPFIEEAEIKLYNILGSLVLEQTVLSTERTIPLSALQSGIYILHLQTPSHSQSIKIIKR